MASVSAGYRKTSIILSQRHQVRIWGKDLGSGKIEIQGLLVDETS